MTTSRLFFARAVLHKAGIPVIPAAEQCLVAVMVGEGSRAAWNPLDTTAHLPGATPYNTFGPHGEYHVWNYAHAADGVNATAGTLRQANMSQWCFALTNPKSTAIEMARAFSRVPWAYVGDVLPLEIVQQYNNHARNYVTDRAAPIAGAGPWPFHDDGSSA